MSKPTNKQLATTVGIAAIVLSISGTLAATWSWALFGMSQSIGVAWFVTSGMLFVSGIVVLFIAEDMD